MELPADLTFPAKYSVEPYSDEEWARAARLVRAGSVEGCENHVGFTDLPCKDPSLRIQVVNVPNTGIMVKLVKTSTDPNATVQNAFDMFLDADYRSNWDEHMIAGYELFRHSAESDVGYYAMRLPIPLRNRDWVAQRAWRMPADDVDTCMILNRSVEHQNAPETSSFIRAHSFMTCFHARKASDSGGIVFTYITINDIKGSIPKMLYDRASKMVAPSTMATIMKGITDYAAWKAANNPTHRPWADPEMCSLPTSPDDPAIWCSPKAYMDEQRRLKKLHKTRTPLRPSKQRSVSEDVLASPAFNVSGEIHCQSDGDHDNGDAEGRAPR